MKTRIISAIVAIPIFLFFVIMGGYWLKAAVAAISLIGMYELYKAVSGKIKAVHFVGFVSAVLYFLLFDYLWPYSGSPTVRFYIFIPIILLFVIMIKNHNTTNINDVSITLFGFIYIPLIFSITLTIREYGLIYIWLPFIYAWVSDTAAYFTGSALGRHKLAPVLSPKKSIEGAVGAVVVTGIVSAVYLCITTSEYSVIRIVMYFLFGALGSVTGQVGDIAASAIKRYTGIKDYGNIMPGHGGVLDRFDSVLFTLPVAYILITYMKLSTFMN